MQRETTIKCDACQKDFQLAEKDIRNRQSGELLFRYIVCPECGAAFISTTTDREFRKLIKKGRMSNKQYEALSHMLNEKYFPRFKELVPTAYDIFTKGGTQ